MKDDVSALLSSQVLAKPANLLGQSNLYTLESPSQTSFNAFKNELLGAKMNSLAMPKSTSSSTTNVDSIDMPFSMKLNSNVNMNGANVNTATSYLNDFEQQIKLLEEQAKQLKSEKPAGNEDFFVISSMQHNNIGLSFDQYKAATNEDAVCGSRNQPYSNLAAYDFTENFSRAANTKKTNSLLPIFHSNSLNNLNRCDSSSLTDIKNEEIYLKQVK